MAAAAAAQVRLALAWLKRRGRRKNVAGIARYGIVAKPVLGVSVVTGSGGAA